MISPEMIGEKDAFSVLIGAVSRDSCKPTQVVPFFAVRVALLPNANSLNNDEHSAQHLR